MNTESMFAMAVFFLWMLSFSATLVFWLEDFENQYSKWITAAVTIAWIALSMILIIH